MSQQQQEQRIIQFSYLTKRLSDLLGFMNDGGTEDILEHLLTIESNADLYDYLTQLLGTSDKKNIQQFVNEIDMYQNGELIIPISSINDNNDGDKKKKAVETKSTNNQSSIPSTHPKQQQQTEGVQKKQLPRNNNDDNNNNIDKQQQEQNNQHNSTKKVTEKKAPPQPAAAASKMNNNNNISSKNNKNKKSAKEKKVPSATTTTTAIVNKNSSSDMIEEAAKVPTKDYEEVIPTMIIPTKQQEQQQQQQQLPEKGIRSKDSIVCGCFGNYHQAICNCLHCGRIACEQEGYYDYCPFCNYLLLPMAEPPTSSSEDTILKAWNEKERLLQYDRECAQRTVVIDDQEDYYMNSNSIWLSDEEQRIAIEQEEQRYNDIHKRTGMKLNLQI